jgi:hypothetical protein
MNTRKRQKGQHESDLKHKRIKKRRRERIRKTEMPDGRKEAKIRTVKKNKNERK